MSDHTPSYRFHKPSCLAVVTFNGRDHYLGKHGTPESRAEYDRLIGEWLLAGRRTRANPAGKGAASPPVNEVILAYLNHAEGYYRKDGRPTTEVGNIKCALRPLRRLYGHTPARDFGPLALKVVRQAMVESGLCRNEVNKRVRHVVPAFRRAVENELVPLELHRGPWGRRGESSAKNSVHRNPAPGKFHRSRVGVYKPRLSRKLT